MSCSLLTNIENVGIKFTITNIPNSNPNDASAVFPELLITKSVKPKQNERTVFHKNTIQ